MSRVDNAADENMVRNVNADIELLDSTFLQFIHLFPWACVLGQENTIKLVVAYE